MNKEVGYVIGPFRAESAWEVECNVRRAEELSLGVWRAGYACICVHAACRHFTGAAPDENWLLGDLHILARCDFAVLANGWSASSGSRAEVDFCHKHGIPVVYPRSKAMPLELLIKATLNSTYLEPVPELRQ